MEKLFAVTLWMSASQAMAGTPLNARTALSAAGQTAESATVVTGQTTWQSDVRGVVHPHKTVDWKTLVGNPVMATATSERPARGRFCQETGNQGGAPGGRTLHLYKQEERDQQAQMILSNNEETPAVFAAIRPGESVQVIEALNSATGERVEHLEIRRSRDSLSLTRGGDGAEICYETAPIQP